MADEATSAAGATTPSDSVSAAGTTGSKGRAAKLPPRQQPKLRILSDKALRNSLGDYLDFKAFAEALAQVIADADTDTPLTIAISARWGAGKTSLARMVEEELTTPARVSRHIVCWFDAWLHQDATHLGAALAADVAKTVDRERPAWRRLFFPLPSAMLTPRERWWRRLLVGSGTVVVVAAVAAVSLLVPSLQQLVEAKAWGKRGFPAHDAAQIAVAALALASLALALWRRLFAVAQAAAAFVDEPGSEAARGAMQDVKAQLGELIHQATRRRRLARNRRLIVFVDDLERCEPERALDLCAVSSQLLAQQDLVTVFIADMAVIAEWAETRYRPGNDAPANGDSGAGEHGRFYLEKIVQIELDLPPVKTEQLRAMLTDYVPPPEPAVQRADEEEPQAGAPTPSVSQEEPVAAGGPPLQRIASAVGTVVQWLLGLLFIVAGIGGAIKAVEAALRSPYAAAAVIIGVVVLLLGALWLYGLYTDRLEREKERIARLVHKSARGATVEALMREARGSVRRRAVLRLLFDDVRLQRLIEETLDAYRSNEAELREQLRSELLDFLPPLPRSAKRTVNRLRLLLLVAEKRRMLGGKPELTAEHVVKWVVLGERWPALARALGGAPERISELEGVTPEALRSALDRLGCEVRAPEELADFLERQPRLGRGILHRLIYFDPADATPPPPRRHRTSGRAAAARTTGTTGAGRT